jgi:periplasmic divalent cation tolerance protein
MVAHISTARLGLGTAARGAEIREYPLVADWAVPELPNNGGRTREQAKRAGVVPDGVHARSPRSSPSAMCGYDHAINESGKELIMADYVEVHVTCDSQAVAERICVAVVEKRLAAGAQFVGPIHSTYWWGGKVQRAEEWLLLMRTTRNRFGALAETVRSLHPYQVPQIVAVPIVDGIADYLSWISSETTARAGDG